MKPKIVLAWLALACCVPAAASAQFLEKLEEAVRSQLENAANDQPAESSEEELPAPVMQENRPQPSESILERELSATELPATAPVVPLPANTADAGQGGGAYLGFEAEELVGGGLGVRISSVSRGSPAWKSGLATEDKLVAVDGFAIAGLENLAERLAKVSPGDTVSFLVNRRGRNIELPVVAMDASLAATIRNRPSTSAIDQGDKSAPVWLGVTANDLTSSFRQQFGLSVFRGAAITEVKPGSPANAAGIRAGDAIIEINGQSIETARDLQTWLANARVGQPAEMIVARGTYTQVKSLVLQSEAAVQPSTRPSTAFRQPVPSTSEPPRTAPTASVPDPSEPSRSELLAEVSRLRSELKATQERLQAAESKLQVIQQSLKD